MKRRRLIYFSWLALLTLVFLSQPVLALDIARENSIENSIVAGCSTIKVRLKQVRANDSLTRVNYGQAYESLIKKVMIPANARLVSNRYDASTLVLLTTQFDKNLSQFRLDYQAYKSQLDTLIDSDCSNGGALNFLQKLETLRVSRAGLRQRLMSLDEAIINYQTEMSRVVDAGRN